jgi:hypothetical protein
VKALDSVWIGGQIIIRVPVDGLTSRTPVGTELELSERSLRGKTLDGPWDAQLLETQEQSPTPFVACFNVDREPIAVRHRRPE